MLNQELIGEFTEKTQGLKYFHVLAVIYIVGIITSLTVSARLIPFHIPFTDVIILLSGGTWTIPLSFFIQDITTEVYGYAKSRQLVQISIVLLLFYIGYTKLITYFPIPDTKNIDHAYNTVFNALPRHLFALITALFVGNLVNDCILSKLKKRLNGQYLAARFIIATAIGEFALQIVGTSLAWAGSLKFQSEILPFIFFSYLYKVGFEILVSPLNIFICNKLKLAEGIDIFDINENYNPFLLTSKKRSLHA